MLINSCHSSPWLYSLIPHYSQLTVSPLNLSTFNPHLSYLQKVVSAFLQIRSLLLGKLHLNKFWQIFAKTIQDFRKYFANFSGSENLAIILFYYSIQIARNKTCIGNICCTFYFFSTCLVFDIRKRKLAGENTTMAACMLTQRLKKLTHPIKYLRV